MKNRSMEKLSFVFVLLISIVIAVHGTAEGPKGVEKWFKTLNHKKEKMTKLHFYFHDTVSGKNPSAIQIAESRITATSPTQFGLTRMTDDLLTVGPDPSSKVVGRAQGIYGLAGLQEIDLIMNLNLVFLNEKYNGSTLSLHGWNPILHEYREMSITGGSGVFRLARGIATAKTYVFNMTSGDAIVEYHVVVLHY